MSREEAGRFFRHMAEFVGFTERDAQIVRETKPLIARHLPTIVTRFYTHLLRYPETRRHFLTASGEVDEAYLELRMRHLSNFWLRAADGLFDDEFAAYVDYAGRAHTSRGADPNIYVAERYVIGQVGMIQNAISETLSRELRETEPEREFAAVEAWDKLLMVILEMLARAYGHEQEAETLASPLPVDGARVAQLAARAVQRELDARPVPLREIEIGAASEIPEGERKLVEVDDLSIGIFHHEAQWIALRNYCIHQGGPVATGPLSGHTLTCPWHGFEFDVRDGTCLADRDAELDRYEVEERDGRLYLRIPEPESPPGDDLPADAFQVADVPPGAIVTVTVEREQVAVYNVAGTFFATQESCPHAGGPLSEGTLEGTTVTCPVHGSCFDVESGALRRGPAESPLRTYEVEVADGVGRVRLRDAARGAPASGREPLHRKLHRYESDAIEVTWDGGRCIHAAECVMGLPVVFDTQKRPWIQPGQAAADQVAEVILRCPTGALHFHRRDDGDQERPPAENTIVPTQNGPLYIRGTLRLLTQDGEHVLEETRMALCRCGASADKPFCDNSHRALPFVDRGNVGDQKPDEGAEPDGTLEITPTRDGPYRLQGGFTILSADGRARYRARQTVLCRCGGSSNKPFCDGTHRRIGFTSG